MSKKIEGYSKQNGTPTPDNPIDIETLKIKLTADEMFEKLGYELVDEKICPHSYRYNKNISRFNIKEIILEKSKKLITICYYKVDVDGYMEPLNLIEYHLSIQELQAINEKVKELGWLDE